MKIQGLISLALTLILPWGCATADKSQAQAPAPPPTSVQVAPATSKTVEVKTQLPAQLTALEVTDVRSRVEGQLLEHPFQEGSRVEKDQVLFRIDPGTYQAAVDGARAQLAQSRGRQAQAEAYLSQRTAALERARRQVNKEQVRAELDEARANYDAARREVERFQPLLEKGAVPRQRYDEVADRSRIAGSRYRAVEARLRNTGVDDRADVDEARANVEAAKADLTAAQAAVQAAQADLQRAELNLSYTVIRAPYSGVIGTLGVDAGSLVIPGQTRLATLSRSDPIYADFELSEASYLSLAGGEDLSTIPFELVLADGRPYQKSGRFVLVDREVKDTGTIKVRASFPNSEDLLKPGGFGKISMRVQELPQAVVIPQKALTSVQSLDVVYVLKQDETVEQRPIQLGPRLEGEVVVESGLKPGELVVTQGLQKIRPGAKVRVAGEVS